MKNNKIAMIISGLRYEGQTMTVNGVLKGAKDHGYEVYIFTCDSSWERIEEIPETLPLFCAEDYDGIIFHGDTIESESLVNDLVSEIVESGVPAVTIKDPHDGMALSGMDNATGIFEIVEHLVNLHGAKTINFIAGAPESADAKDREAAFRSVMNKAGLPVDEKRIITGYFSPQGGREAFRRWYEMRDELPLPDAIVSASDWMAMGAMEEMKRHGIRYPEDIIITGYDDTLISRISEPPLTTVKLPNYEIGLHALELVAELIETGEIKENERIGNHALFRGSCGCVTYDVSDIVRDAGLRDKYFYDSLYRTNYLDVIKNVQRDFAGVRSWNAFYDMVAKSAKVFDADAFFMCTTIPEQSRSMALSDLMEREEETVYSSKADVSVALVKGERRNYASFPARKLVSDEMRADIEGKYYVIMPLHYQKHKFGYCMVCNSEVAYDSNFYSLFIQTISSAMENLWAKSRLANMIDILDELWIYDKLAGVMNRSGFERYAKRMIKDARDEGKDIFLLFADLDGLKKVNDTYGHEAGDEYIKEAANILRAVHKKGELLMRYGGDEFVVMAEGYTPDEADEYVKAVKEMVRYVNTKNYEFHLGISLGYVIKKADERFSLDEAIEEADSMMYDDKKASR